MLRSQFECVCSMTLLPGPARVAADGGAADGRDRGQGAGAGGPAAQGAVRGGAGAAADGGVRGRGLHSSTFQLNLSHFSDKVHPRQPLIPPDTPYTPPRQPLNVPRIPQIALKLSRKVNECKPLVRGAGSAAGLRAHAPRRRPRHLRRDDHPRRGKAVQIHPRLTPCWPRLVPVLEAKFR